MNFKNVDYLGCYLTMAYLTLKEYDRMRISSEKTYQWPTITYEDAGRH